MPRMEEYRNNATQSFVLARHASSFDEKARLLELAERWLDLADRIAKRAKRQARDAQQWAKVYGQRPHS
jgi:hypothetical protein